MAEEPPTQKRRVEKEDRGDHKAEPQTALMRRDAAVRSILERMPPVLFVEMLSFLSMQARPRVYVLNKLMKASFKDKRELSWSRTLVLTRADERGWYARARQLNVPWLPEAKALRRLVITGPAQLSEFKAPSPLADPAIQASVTDLTVRGLGALPGGGGTVALGWPFDGYQMCAWTSLTRLRLQSGSELSQTLLPPDLVVYRILMPLTQRSEESSALTALRVEEMSKPWPLVDARRFLGVAGTLWSGLEILGLAMRGVDDAFWTQLTIACPRLEKVVIRDTPPPSFEPEAQGWSSHMTDKTLAIVGAAWPRMRYFWFRSDAAKPAALTTTGLAALTTWCELQVLKIEGPRVADLTALPVQASTDFASLLSSWPKLRRWDTRMAPIVINNAIRAAFGRHLQAVYMGRFPLPADREVAGPRNSEDFFRSHPNLREWPSWRSDYSVPSGTNETIGWLIRYCPEYRVIWNEDTTALEEVVAEVIATLRQLRRLTTPVSTMSDGDRVLRAFLDTRQRPLSAPADWTPRPRSLMQLELTVRGIVVLGEAGLDAIVATCPALDIFSIKSTAPNDILQRSETNVSVAKILHVLRRCPKLTQFILDIAPLAGVDELNDDLRTLDDLVRAVACLVRFRVRRFRDASEESNQWFARAAPLPISPAQPTIYTLQFNLKPRPLFAFF
jgi:hypothetical protein